RMIADVNRPTWMARFASKYRSRRQLLPPDTAKEVVSVFSQHLRQADVNAVARSYAEALPYLPPHVDVNRDRTYRRMLRMIGKPKESGCKRKANGRRKPC